MNALSQSLKDISILIFESWADTSFFLLLWKFDALKFCLPIARHKVFSFNIIN
jgi:hypothetical protein